MPIDENFLRETICKTLSNMKCRSCGQQYEPANVCFRGHRENCWFISVYCPGCRVLIPGIIHVGMSDMPETVTYSNDVKSSKVSTPIDLDDLVDIHAFLKDFSGDFRTLFPKNKE